MNKHYKKETESTLEYILPDYMGDVKKMLSLKAAAVPAGKFLSDGKVNFSGVVYYDVLYADSEGKLTKLMATSDYEINESVPEDGYIDSRAEPKVVNLSVRVTGPRKLSIRAGVCCDVGILSENDLTPEGDAFLDESCLEAAKSDVTIESLSYFISGEREYAEEAEKLVGVLSEDIDVISTSGAVNIFESIPTDDGVLVRGEIVITSIIRTEEQPPFAIKKAIPFEETVTLTAQVGSESAVRGYLTSVSTGVRDDEDGAMVTAMAILELSGTIATNTSVTVMRDAYLPNRDTESEYADFSYESLVKMSNVSIPFSTVHNRKELECENIRDILALDAEMKNITFSKEENRLKVEGEIAFSGVACEITENLTAEYIPLKFSSPIVLDVNVGCHIPENASLACNIYPGRVDFTIDTDTILAKCLIDLDYHLSAKKSIKRLSSCSIVGDAEYTATLSEIKVYYPDEGESLFDIAKKFHTTEGRICEVNNLSVEAGSFPENNSSPKRIIIR